MSYKIVSLSPDNLAKHPQYVCFINPKHQSYQNKHEWLISQMRLGLRILLLYPAGEKKAQAYIEYTPGEHAWRQLTLMVICSFTVYGLPPMHGKTGDWEQP